MVKKEDLAEVNLFSQLTEDEREKIAEVTERKEFFRDTPIFNETTPGGRLFIVHRGEVEITRLIREHHKQILVTLKNGDFFGGVSFIDGREHSASAVCSTDSVIFIIKKENFDKLSEQYPELGTKILRPITSSICSFLRIMHTKFQDMVEYVSLTR